jgi:phage terminase large subunit-like protein
MDLVPVPPEFLRTRSDEQAVELGYLWSWGPVNRVLKFASTLRDPVDPAKPYRLQPWQLDIVQRLFGWRRPNRRRRFNRVDLWIPKKNGKTSFIAFLLLNGFLNDGELKPVCAGTSITGERANEFYTEGKALLGYNPLSRASETAWCRWIDFQDYRHKMLIPALPGWELYALPCSASGAEGIKGSTVAIDEIHVALTLNPKLYGTFRYAGSGRRQPIIITASTAGDNVKGRAYEIYADSKKILQGNLIDLHTLPVIYEAPPKEEGQRFTAEELAAANPGVGHVLELEQLLDDYKSARPRPREHTEFLRYRANVWTKKSSGWLDAVKWMSFGVRLEDMLPRLAGKRCVVGIDAASRRDLFAAAAVVELERDCYFVWPHFWLPREGIEDRCEREMDYLAADKSGDMALLDGSYIDASHVGGWIKRLRDDRGLTIPTLAFDPNKTAELAKDLQADGFDCVAVRQGYHLSEAALKFEACQVAKQIVHDGNGVMTWCVQNVEVRKDLNGKIMPIKPPDDTQRIDGVIAAVIALHVLMFTDSSEFVCG